ncbi:hypothetical protein [Anoxybacteroides amylolyticum]|uniref:hypothetical protein n=1 Tax=Anoxybacteroides amylolyticum TaxID=294699 RepID=UPI00131476CC|nr:hypothetical protein [Anoxybacillus amylolyticus]
MNVVEVAKPIVTVTDVQRIHQFSDKTVVSVKIKWFDVPLTLSADDGVMKTRRVLFFRSGIVCQ